MTAASARLLKADHVSDATSRQRVRLADLSETPATSSCFELLDFAVPQSRPRENPSTKANAALAALTTAAAELHAQRDSWLEQCQHETIALAIAIAERLLRRTLAAQPEAVIELVRTTLDWTVGAATVRVRLHPDDCEFVQSQAESLRRECSADIEFVRDETLARGDCVSETTHGVIDGRVDTLLDRIAEELLTGS